MQCGRAGKTYATVRLCFNGACKDRKVHQLVAEAFIGPKELGVVRHKNDDRTNNALSNLEYGTVKQNTHDAVHNGRHKQLVLTPQQAQQILTRRTSGETGKALAAEFGVTMQTICDIFKGRRAVIGDPA